MDWVCSMTLGWPGGGRGGGAPPPKGGGGGGGGAKKPTPGGAGPRGRPRLLIAARQSNAPARSLQKGTTGPGAPTYFKRLEGCSGVMLRPGVSIGPHDPHHSGQQGGHSHDLIQHDNSTPFLFCHYLTPPPSILSMDAPPILLPALPSPVVHFFVFSTNSKTDTILLHFMLIFR